MEPFSDEVRNVPVGTFVPFDLMPAEVEGDILKVVVAETTTMAKKVPPLRMVPLHFSERTFKRVSGGWERIA